MTAVLLNKAIAQDGSLETGVFSAMTAIDETDRHKVVQDPRSG
jgi:hypothetical protein